jgi:hypothetical protein
VAEGFEFLSHQHSKPSAAGIVQSQLVFCHQYSFSFYPLPEALEGKTNIKATLHSATIIHFHFIRCLRQHKYKSRLLICLYQIFLEILHYFFTEAGASSAGG